jgi:hypothetical protein
MSCFTYPDLCEIKGALAPGLVAYMHSAGSPDSLDSLARARAMVGAKLPASWAT